jgi:predicted RND superfamily exporter protein
MRFTNPLPALTRFSVRRPVLVLAIAAALSALALGLAAARLTLRTSNLDLVDPTLPPVKAFLDFAHEFGTPNVLVVVLEGDDPRRLEEAVDQLAPALRAVAGVKTVVDRLPLPKDLIARLGVDEYLMAHDRRLFMLFVQPSDPHSGTDTIAPLVEAVRGVLAQAHLDGAGVRAGLTGIPQYALDDRDVVQRDLSMLSFVSFGLILAVFVLGFGAFRRPAMAMLTLLVVVAVTIGIVAVYPGHLTLLSAFFASILFGLGIDYGIHLVNRVEEFIAEGRTEREAIPLAAASLSRGLTTGALTTAATFFSLQLSGFRGFAELGFIAGAGILVCLVAMMTALPAMLVLAPHRRRDERPALGSRIGRFLLARQSPWLAAACIAAGVACLFVPGPGFDSDYLNLEPKNSEAVRLEREMVKRSDYSPQFAVFSTNSRERAATLADRLLEDDTVGEVRSIADLDLLERSAGAPLQLPEYFRGGFRSPAGRYAVYAYPAGNVWDPAQRDRFLAGMKALDGNVTGMPVLGAFMVDLSQQALRTAALWGSLLLVLCVLADFRSLRLTALACLPTFLTGVSLHAVMRAIGIPFNPLNIMALPVILGIAVDNGVHIVHRFIAEDGDLRRALTGTRRSVVLTSAPTIAALGTPALTSHRGPASFAIALTLGVTIALVLSVIVLPPILVRFRTGILAGKNMGGGPARRLDGKAL